MDKHASGLIKLRDDEPGKYNGAFIAADSIGAGYYGSICSVTQRDAHPVHGGGISQAMAEANARRMVACWNACDGISTDDLERIAAIGGLEKLRNGSGS